MDIPLTLDKVAIIDDADAALVAGKWYAFPHGQTHYAVKMLRIGKTTR